MKLIAVDQNNFISRHIYLCNQYKLHFYLNLHTLSTLHTLSLIKYNINNNVTKKCIHNHTKGDFYSLFSCCLFSEQKKTPIFCFTSVKEFAQSPFVLQQPTEYKTRFHKLCTAVEKCPVSKIWNICQLDTVVLPALNIFKIFWLSFSVADSRPSSSHRCCLLGHFKKKKKSEKNLD